MEIDGDAVRTFVGSLMGSAVPPTTPGPSATPAPSPATPPTTARPADDDDPITVQRADATETNRSPAPSTSNPPVITAEGVPCVD